MTFLNPQGFFGLLLALPIIALYLMRLHYVDTVIPSLALWQSLLQDRHANHLWQKLRKHWLLFLQLLVLLLVVVSLAQPAFPAPLPTPERVFVFLDVSASMKAQTEGDGTRFSEAVSEIQHTLSGLGSKENLTLISVGLTPEVVVNNVDLNQFAKALKALAPQQGTADWNSAPRLAAGLAGAERASSTTTLVVSDFATSDMQAFEEAPFPGELSVINVGDLSANAGIVNFAIQRTDTGTTAFLRIQNAGSQTTRTVDILADGVLFSRQTMTLLQDASVTVSYEGIPAEAWVEAVLVEPDVFTLDDHAWAVLDDNSNQATLLVSAGNRFLAQALASLPGIDFYQTSSLMNADILDEGQYASLVVDSVPVPALLPANLWMIAPEGESVCGTPENIFVQPAHVNGQWQHPILDYVDWSDVHVSQARFYHIPANSEILMQFQVVPLLWTVERDGYKAVCTGFKLQDSDLPLRLAFPVLTSNIMRWLTSSTAEGPYMALTPGQVWVPALTVNTTTGVITGPDNDQRPVPLDGSGIVLDAVGLYRYTATTPAGPERTFVAVSLLDSRESDLRSRHILKPAAQTAAPPLTMGKREINRWTIALAVVLCLLEAVLWWYRGYGSSKVWLSSILKGSGIPFAVILRCVMVILLIGAFLGVRFQRRTRDLNLVFVVDHSASTQSAWDEQDEFIKQALAAKKPKDQVAVILYGQDAWVDRSFSSGNTLAPHNTIPERSATDSEQAIRLAMALLPQDAPGRIVLMSDGLETTGQASEALRDALARGIDVQLVQPEAGIPASEVWVEELQVPTMVYPGDQVPINLRMATNTPQTVRVNWTVGTEVGYAFVDLGANNKSFQFSIAIESAGFVPVRVCVEPVADQYIENNCAETWIVAQGPRQVLVVGDQSERAALSAALQSAGLQLNEVEPGAMPQTLESLSEYGAVILVNTPVRDLPVQGIGNIVPYVRDVGGGLIAVGGPESYGVGGWLGTALEQVLPVEMRVLDPQRFPPMIMALVIDTSGSMASDENGIPKITLAAEAALRVAESLNVGDTLVVIGYSDGLDDTFGPISVDLRQNLQQEFYTLRAGGGGIFVYESLEYALETIAGVTQDNADTDNNATQSHIILLADGSDAEHQEGVLNLVKAPAEDGLSISVISIGLGEDVPFLSALAEAGDGRFYLADHASDLPSIFTEEVARSKRSYIVEEPFYPEIASAWEPVAGLRAFPPLLGYVAVSPKSSAEIVWYAHADDPLLAVWQYGLGRSVAWMSDATSRWSAQWVPWDRFSQFWGSLTRAVMTPDMDRDVEVRVQVERQIARVTVDLTGNAAVADENLDLRLRFSGVSMVEEDLTTDLEQVAPGRYEGTVSGVGPHSYLVRLYGDRNLVFGWSPPPSREYLPGDAAAAISSLADQSGALLITKAMETVEHNITRLNHGQPLTLPLLALSAFLWVSDVAWRRLSLTWQAIIVFFLRFKRTRIKASRKLETATPLTGNPSTVSRLSAVMQSRQQNERIDDQISHPSPGDVLSNPERAGNRDPEDKTRKESEDDLDDGDSSLERRNLAARLRSRLRRNDHEKPEN